MFNTLIALLHYCNERQHAVTHACIRGVSDTSYHSRHYSRDRRYTSATVE